MSGAKWTRSANGVHSMVLDPALGDTANIKWVGDGWRWEATANGPRGRMRQSNYGYERTVSMAKLVVSTWHKAAKRSAMRIEQVNL